MTLPSFIVIQPSMILHENGTFFCYDTFWEGYYQLDIELIVSPNVFNYLHCSCTKTFIGVPPNCVDCPEHSICNGGRQLNWKQVCFIAIPSNPSNPKHHLRKGYSPIFDSNGNLQGVESCKDLLSGNGDYSRCNPSGTCSGVYQTNQTSGQQCTLGFGLIQTFFAL